MTKATAAIFIGAFCHACVAGALPRLMLKKISCNMAQAPNTKGPTPITRIPHAHTYICFMLFFGRLASPTTAGMTLSNQTSSHVWGSAFANLCIKGKQETVSNRAHQPHNLFPRTFLYFRTDSGWLRLGLLATVQTGLERALEIEPRLAEVVLGFHQEKRRSSCQPKSGSSN